MIPKPKKGDFFCVIKMREEKKRQKCWNNSSEEKAQKKGGDIYKRELDTCTSHQVWEEDTHTCAFLRHLSFWYVIFFRKWFPPLIFSYFLFGFSDFLLVYVLDGFRKRVVVFDVFVCVMMMMKMRAPANLQPVEKERYRWEVILF